MIYSINTFALSRQNNQESCALHGNVINLISAANASQIGMSQQFVTQYEAQLSKLTDQVYTTQGSEHTATMQAADAARGKIYMRIHSKLTFATLAEDGHDLQKIASKVQSDFLSKYNGRVPQLAQQEETAVIKGFVFDLGDKLTAEERDLLGITADIAKLEKTNDDFQKAYLSRADERADAEQLEKTTSIRNTLAELFSLLCINVEYWANNTDADAASKRDACQTFASRLNVLLADALNRIRQRRKGVDDESGSGSGSNSGSGNNGSSSGNGSNLGVGTGSGSDTGSGTDSGGSGTGSGSGSSTGNDHEIHDGVTEW